MSRFIAVVLGLWLALAQAACAAAAKSHETGFLDRSVFVQGVEYRYEQIAERFAGFCAHRGAGVDIFLFRRQLAGIAI